MLWHAFLFPGLRFFLSFFPFASWSPLLFLVRVFKDYLFPCSLNPWVAQYVYFGFRDPLRSHSCPMGPPPFSPVRVHVVLLVIQFIHARQDA
jgi:hypothetical protein